MLIQEYVEKTNKEDLSLLEYTILQVLVYADIFDYPLTSKEIYLFFTTAEASYKQIKLILDNYLVPNKVSKCGVYYTLIGREILATTRAERSLIARKLWSKAIFYTNFIHKLPFVRMIAVTGSLAVNNTSEGADIDLFIVTQAKRLWISRLSIVLVMKIAKIFHSDLCPNFLISEDNLLLKEQTFYTAREFVQMVPLSGKKVYSKLYEANDWVNNFCPNAYKRRAFYHSPANTSSYSRVQMLLEFFMRTRAFDKIERWEMNRTSTKLLHLSNYHSENNFTLDCCKSHLYGYQKRILHKYNQRLQKIRKNDSISNKV